MKLPMRCSRGALLAAGAGLGVAVLMLVPGNWGTARAQTGGEAPTAAPVLSPTTTPTSTAATTATAVATAAPVVMSVARDAPATVAVPVSGMSLDIKPNTFGTDVIVTFTPLTLTQGDPGSAGSLQSVAEALQALNIPSPPAVALGDSQVVNIFQLQAVSTTTGSDIGGTATELITMAVTVTPEVLALAGNHLANVSLQFFDPATQAWVEVPCVEVGGGLSCSIPHFSTWALVVRKVAPAQATAAPKPANTGAGLPLGSPSGDAGSLLPLTLAVLALGVGGGIGARALRRRAR